MDLTTSVGVAGSLGGWRCVALAGYPGWRIGRLWRRVSGVVRKAVRDGLPYLSRVVSRAKGSSYWIRSPCCNSGNRSIESVWNSLAEVRSKP